MNIFLLWLKSMLFWRLRINHSILRSRPFMKCCIKRLTCLTSLVIKHLHHLILHHNWLAYEVFQIIIRFLWSLGRWNWFAFCIFWQWFDRAAGFAVSLVFSKRVWKEVSSTVFAFLLVFFYTISVIERNLWWVLNLN